MHFIIARSSVRVVQLPSGIFFLLFNVCVCVCVLEEEFLFQRIERYNENTHYTPKKEATYSVYNFLNNKNVRLGRGDASMGMLGREDIDLVVCVVVARGYSTSDVSEFFSDVATNRG